MTNGIVFHELGLRNILSFDHNLTKFKLDGDYITVIIGENRDTGGEDSRNGCGKSAIIDGLTYCLFGKVIRQITNQKLIHKWSQKGQMLIYVTFDKGSYQYLVERGERPSKLHLFRKDIDDDTDFKAKVDNKFKYDISRNKTETTDEIIDILGFDLTLFEYLVANTTESTEFFKLGEDKQRAVTEPLFGFNVMSERAKVLKEQRRVDNKTLIELESSITATIQANTRIQSEVDTLSFQSTQWESKKQQAIIHLNKSIEELQKIDVDSEIDVLKLTNELTLKVSEIKSTISLIKSETSNHRRELTHIEHNSNSLISDIKKCETDLDALDHSKCPTCEQHWEPDPQYRHTLTDKKQHAETQVSNMAYKTAEIDKLIENTTSNNNTQKASLDEYMDLLNELSQSPTHYKSVDDALMASSNLSNLTERLESKTEETNPHLDTITRLQNETIVEIDKTELNQQRSLIKHYTYLIELLTKRDSFLRKQVIDKWLPILNNRIEHWLNILELPHRVTFNPDLTINITEFQEEFDYGNLSGGERGRLRFALNLSFQDVFEYINYPINFLAIDELIDNGICPRGAENAVNALQMACVEKGKRLYLITHREDIAARITDVMKVIKFNKKTYIEYN